MDGHRQAPASSTTRLLWHPLPRGQSARESLQKAEEVEHAPDAGTGVTSYPGCLVHGVGARSPRPPTAHGRGDPAPTPAPGITGCTPPGPPGVDVHKRW